MESWVAELHGGRRRQLRDLHDERGRQRADPAHEQRGERLLPALAPVAVRLRISDCGLRIGCCSIRNPPYSTEIPSAAVPSSLPAASSNPQRSSVQYEVIARSPVDRAEPAPWGRPPCSACARLS